MVPNFPDYKTTSKSINLLPALVPAVIFFGETQKASPNSVSKNLFPPSHHRGALPP